MNISGIAFRKGDNSYETGKLRIYCISHDITYKFLNDHDILPDNYVPSGSVEWCEKLLGHIVTPDYYPEWMLEHLERKVYKQDHFPIGEKVFIKPADRHKRFNGFITNGSWKGKKRGPYWCSEVVSFDNEWRYYITNGKLISADWYYGDEINTPLAPELPLINFPIGWCGTLDMGINRRTGNLILVESHPPFACGWYGEDIEKYLAWLTSGWKFLNKKEYTK